MTIKPFKNRVRVLVEIPDDADELALVTAVFRGRGWMIRPPRSSEVRGHPTSGRTWLLLELRFPGFSSTAVKTAVKRVEQVINRFDLAVWVRRAEVVRHTLNNSNAYLIEEATPSWLARNRVLAEVARLFGIPRTTGLISVEQALPEPEVREKLAAVDLCHPFDPTRSSIRPAVAGKSPDGGPVAAEMAPFRSRLVGTAGLAVTAICGYAAGCITSGWMAIPIVLGIIASVPLIRSLPINQSLPRRLCLAALYTLFLLALGIFLARNSPVRSPIFAPVAAVGVGVAIIVWRGLVLALRDSWLIKQITWIIPLAVTVFFPLALWLGGMYDTQYLTYGFGIPSDTVSIPTLFRLAIASKSALLGLGFVLFFIAIIGWIRYFHWAEDGARWLSWLTIALLAAIYLLSSISTGLAIVSDASARAAEEASAGRQPNSYFGIQGTLMCFRPVTKSIPVYNGPLPSNKPMLSFGTTSDELWVWNPESKNSIGVPLNEVIAIPATGLPARCK